MHSPHNPDPAPRRPAEQPGDPAPPSASTSSHPSGHPPAADALGPPGSSTVPLLGSSLVRLRAAAAGPGGNTDDAPTVITGHKPAAAVPAGADVAGKRLGHFELVESIGSGGMATVLKARDLELGRTVALKILPPETARDPEAVNRFKQEARSAARLDHDNVARVYFCGEDQGLHFIAFEFVEGENLRHLIDRRGPLPAGECVRYMLQVAAGLAHAADRGVVHRDIKPSNILVTPDGRAKIVDMGLARHRESHSVNGGVTQSGVTLGTFDYISPEQALDPRRADVRSDIYSLGCAFYHALTGRPPVPEGTAAKKLHAHQHEYPLDPRELNPHVPDGLAVVLSKMMAKDPARRYQTPAELIRDLTGLARAWNLPLDGVADVFASATAPALVPEPPRLPVGWLTAGGIAAAAAVVFFAATGSPGPAPAPPWADPEKPAARAGLPDPSAGGQPAPPAPPVRAGRPPADAREFAAAVKAGEARIALRRGRTYDLAGLAEPVDFAGAELALEAVPDPDPDPAADPTRPPVVRVAAAPVADDAPRAGTLTVRGAKRVTVRNVAFEVAARGDDPPADADPVGVWVAGADRVEFDGCRVRLDPDSAGTRLTGVAVTAPPGRRAELAVQHALFDLGPHGAGLRLAGRVAADVRHAAFGPHEAAVRLAPEAGAGGDGGGTLALRECTFMLADGSAAVEAEGGAAFQVEAGFCLFAAASAPAAAAGMPGAAMPGAADARPAVLRVAADTPAAAPTRFAARAGEPNAYYRAAAFATTTKNYSFDEARELGPPPPAADPAAVVLARPPWAAENPRPRLAQATHPEAAFRLNLDERKLRVDAEARLVGAKLIRGDRDRIYDPWPPPRPKLPVEARAGQRVYFPAADTADARDRVYEDFLAAFTRLEPGETLLVAATGPVPVPALPERENLRATIKAYPGYAPELVPAGPTRLRDAALFKLPDGELTLENLAVTLTARQAVVAVSGGRGVTFRNCVLTLDERDDPQAAVAVADPAREMRMGPAELPPAPAVRFENTLVRGKGRAVWVQAARPFDLAAENAAFALDGPLVQVDPPGKDLPATPPPATVRLARVTAVLNGPVLALHAPKEPTGRVVQVAVEADRCLFAPTSPIRPKPLVVVEDADPAAEVKKYLTWRAGGPSVYANLGRLAAALELRPAADDGTPPTAWDLDRWIEFAREGGSAARVRFAGKPHGSRLAAVKPADLRAELHEADAAGSTAVDAGANAAEVGVVGEK